MRTAIVRDNHVNPDKPEHQAACADQDPDLFFPTSYTSLEAAFQIARARAVCDRCPIRDACLDTALEHEGGKHISYRHGIWAGKTPSQRLYLTRLRRVTMQQDAA